MTPEENLQLSKDLESVLSCFAVFDKYQDILCGVDDVQDFNDLDPHSRKSDTPQKYTQQMSPLLDGDKTILKTFL